MSINKSVPFVNLIDIDNICHWTQPGSVPRHGLGCAYGARRPSALARHIVHMPVDVAAGFQLREAMQREVETALVTDPARASAMGFGVTHVYR